MAKDKDAPSIADDTAQMIEADVKKKKPRKFFFLYKGTQIKTLVVFKKGPFGPQIMKAKKAGFLGDVCCGVVVGSGEKITFQIPATGDVAAAMKVESWESEPPVEVVKLKKFLKDNGLSVKPQYDMITSVEAVLNPDQEEAVGPTDAKPDNGPAEDAAVLASKLVEALKRLKPLVDQVVDADASKKGELHTTFSQIAAEIKSQQFDQAKRGIADFATQLKSLTSQQPTSSGEGNEELLSELTARRDALEPRLLEAQKADREKATKLGALWDYANDQVQVNSFASAAKAFDGLEVAIDGILALGSQTESSQENGQPAAGVSSPGLVAKRKFLATRWQKVPSDLRLEVATLQKAIDTLLPDEDAQDISQRVDSKLTELTAEMKSTIDDALDEDINRGDSEYGRTVQVIGEMRSSLSSEPLIVALRESTLSDGARFESTFLTCLEELQVELSS